VVDNVIVMRAFIDKKRRMSLRRPIVLRRTTV